MKGNLCKAKALDKIYIIFLLLFSSAIGHLQAFSPTGTREENSIEVGYPGNSFGNFQGYGASRKLAAAIQLPQEYIGMYAGNRLSEIRFYLGQTSSATARVFITRDLNSEHLYTQELTVQPQAWNSVILKEPFDLTGEQLFLGYEITSKGYPLAMYEDVDSPYGDWMAVEDEWTRIGTESGRQYSFAIIGVVRGDRLPAYNVSLEALSVPYYIQKGKTYTLSGELRNKALETITDFELSYRIGNDDPRILRVAGLDLAYNGETEFSAEGFSVPEEGDFDIEFTVSRINGQEDTDMSDNGRRIPVICRSAYLPRKVLMENFTSEYCTDCPKGHKRLNEALVAVADRTVVVEHHAGFADDDYTLPESWEYVNKYYNDFTTYAPAGMIDRSNLSAYGAMSYSTRPSPGPVFDLITNDIAGLLGKSLERPAYVRLDLNTEYDSETRKVNIEVSGEFVLPPLSENAWLSVFVTEDSIFTTTQLKGDNYYHRHLLRRIVNGIWGERVSVQERFSRNYVVTLSEEWNPYFIGVAAFVGNYDETDPNNCMVYNSENQELKTILSAATERGETPEASCCFDPVGRRWYVKGRYDRAEVYDISGRLITSFAGEDMPHPLLLNGGVYLVRIRTEFHSDKIQKIMIP